MYFYAIIEVNTMPDSKLASAQESLIDENKTESKVDSRTAGDHNAIIRTEPNVRRRVKSTIYVYQTTPP